MHIITDSSEESYCAIKLGFKTTNNEVKYKALLARFIAVEAFVANEVDIKADSQVIINQVIGEYMEKVGKLEGMQTSTNCLSHGRVYFTLGNGSQGIRSPHHRE